MKLLETFIRENNDTLENIQAECLDTRTLGGTWWQAILTINEEPTIELDGDYEDEAKNLTSLNLFIDEEQGKLLARYTLTYEIYGVGVSDKVTLELNNGATVEQSMEWFKQHYKDFDLEEIILPTVQKFFEQSNPLFASL